MAEMPRIRWEDIPEPVRADMNISREDFESLFARMAEREQRAPGPGDAAPGFRLRRLDGRGRRTDRFVELAELRGRPVGLVFGSYT